MFCVTTSTVTRRGTITYVLDFLGLLLSSNSNVCSSATKNVGAPPEEIDTALAIVFGRPLRRHMLPEPISWGNESPQFDGKAQFLAETPAP
jgi:hypothetical protein